MAFQVQILTKEQAGVRRTAKPKAARRARAKTTVQRRHDRKTRPDGYARQQNLHVEPWKRVKGHRSIGSALQALREAHKDRAHIPSSMVQRETAMALYEGRWHKFLMLDNRVCVRRLRGAWGMPAPGHMPCDACFFRTDSRALLPVAVGTSNATVQVFHVCVPCLSEGVLGRTAAQGYVAKRLE
jgi:hypothetical protein